MVAVLAGWTFQRPLRLPLPHRPTTFRVLLRAN